MIRKKASREELSLRPSGGVLSRHGRLRRFLHYAGLVLIFASALVLAGFLRFADAVTTFTPPVDAKADAIVVLTGGYQRIDQAIELLRKGMGRRLLISGVHPTTTPAQIRKVTQSSPDLFECCVDVGYEAMDTIGNANETSRWIHDRGYSSVLVVTSNYHMPRSLMELRRIDPSTTFIPLSGGHFRPEDDGLVCGTQSLEDAAFRIWQDAGRLCARRHRLGCRRGTAFQEPSCQGGMIIRES